MTRSGGLLRVWVGTRKEAKLYFASWSGAFEWQAFVGVDAFAYGKTGS